MKLFPIEPGGVVRIDDERSKNILASDIVPEHVKAIVRAMRDYDISWFFIPQIDQPIERRVLQACNGYIAVVSDDTDCAKGPEAFDQTTLRCLIENAAGVSVMSCDFMTDVYALFSSMSGMLRTGTTVIETRPEMEDTWLSYICSISQTVPIILCTSKHYKGAA
ncbi:MAG: hypothetical protein PHD48_05230 [Alphaproteobacteria bacterium]|nr:hypothetical protein [Alphaproteobacteria bacterium]